MRQILLHRSAGCQLRVLTEPVMDEQEEITEGIASTREELKGISVDFKQLISMLQEVVSLFSK